MQFSQRDLQGFYQSDAKTTVKSYSGTTHGLYPVLALPCLYTNRSSRTTSGDAVVVENGSTSITVKEDGNVDVVAPLTTFSGDVRIEGNTTMKGNLQVNGSSITHQDTEIGRDHRHDQDNDSDGNSEARTSTPVITP